MIKITLTGNIATTPTLKTAGDKEVLSFGCVSNIYLKKESVAQYFQISMFGKRASSIVEYLKKGQHITVSGDFYYEEYEGKKHLKIITNDIDFYTPKATVENNEPEGSTEYPEPF